MDNKPDEPTRRDFVKGAAAIGVSAVGAPAAAAQAAAQASGPRAARRGFEAAVPQFEKIVGKPWVLVQRDDLDGYLDPYALGDGREHAAGGAVAPASVEEVQAVIRVANEHRVPLWPISRGKNFGYGSAAPVRAGTVMLDLTRMNRILELDEKLAYCVLEPGVGFFDLWARIRAENMKLWLSPPGNSSGSVIGNALEHGSANTPYGDHAFNLCGMEVVLGNGNRVRTGMGAMEGSKTWHLYKHAYGPNLDPLFTQSNFGVVTRAGMWLMPEPEATLTMNLEAPNPGDLEWLVDALAPLRTAGTVRQVVTLRNYLRVATLRSKRADWYTGEGAMPDSVIAKILKTYGIGWWSLALRLYGLPGVNEATAEHIQKRFAGFTDQKFSLTRWHQGEPYAGSGLGEPATTSMQALNWSGGRGSHIAFSPNVPLNGKLAREQFERTRRLTTEYGFDYYGANWLWDRSITIVGSIYYDRDNAEQVGRLKRLFKALIADSKQHGYGEYRTHIDFMDEVARSFDYNGYATMRMQQAIKQALDPNGLIAPGKSGIWPQGQGWLT